VRPPSITPRGLQKTVQWTSWSLPLLSPSRRRGHSGPRRGRFGPLGRSSDPAPVAERVDLLFDELAEPREGEIPLVRDGREVPSGELERRRFQLTDARPSPPHGADQSGVLQYPEVLGDRLPGHAGRARDRGHRHRPVVAQTGDDAKAGRVAEGVEDRGRSPQRCGRRGSTVRGQGAFRRAPSACPIPRSSPRTRPCGGATGRGRTRIR
jgi:hypothetical protein